MRNKVMEYAQGSYIHGEEFIGLHISMGNVDIDSNGRIDKQDPVTMRILEREVQIYKDDNERIMKAHEEII
jgi:hypothetical protein